MRNNNIESTQNDDGQTQYLYKGMIRYGGRRRGRYTKRKKGCDTGDEKKLRKEIEINVRATNLDRSSSLLTFTDCCCIQTINLSVDT